MKKPIKALVRALSRLRFWLMILAITNVYHCAFYTRTYMSVPSCSPRSLDAGKIRKIVKWFLKNTSLSSREVRENAPNI